MKTGNIGCSVEKKAVIRKNYIYGGSDDNIWGNYYPKEGVCVKKGLRGSRMAGDFFRVNGQFV